MAVIKEFWQDNGFLIDTESQQTGIMETDWAENAAKIPDSVIRKALRQGARQRLFLARTRQVRTRLERSDDPGATEVYISHRGMAQINTSKDRLPGNAPWQVRPCRSGAGGGDAVTPVGPPGSARRTNHRTGEGSAPAERQPLPRRANCRIRS
jgi:hypothetical protein